MIEPIQMFRYNPETEKPEPLKTVKGDPVADGTYKAALAVVDHFRETYGRNSFDNQGSPLGVVVGYAPFRKPLNNAFWQDSDKRLYFGDGDGRTFAPLGLAKDVVAHEFIHGVITSEVKLKYKGEEGGIHESWADVLATGLDTNTQIGEDIFTPGISGDAIRDIADLTYTHVSQLPPVDGPHYGQPHLMGQPLSHAAYLASREIGLDKVRSIWYSAITDHMKDHSGFLGARQATLSAAKSLFGDNEATALTQAWDAVGILDAT